ncbi:MAG: ATP-dependent protease LonB [Thermoplasmata archaeon]
MTDENDIRPKQLPVAGVSQTIPQESRVNKDSRENKENKNGVKSTNSNSTVSEDNKEKPKILEEPVEEWIKKQNFNTTAEIPLPQRLVDQVIGQDLAVDIVKKAAEQKRHVILIGDPGTGKSMLAQAMSELLPKDELQDILAYPNIEDPNEPKIRVVPAGKGKEIVKAQKAEAARRKDSKLNFTIMIIFFVMALSLIFAISYDPNKGGLVIEPTYLLVGIIISAMIFMAVRWSVKATETTMVPKLLISHDPNDMPPFVDATGAHAGALLGDVKHDPFQSGGLETPAHERVEVGAIHKANKGVLFIDEINTLRIESQQNLLTAMQEKKYSIVGQSERSAGAMVKTEPVPCDFILVAAGNLDSIEGMHPALRSRIRGYGYEVFIKATMDDTDENRKKLIRFVAQEVVKDKKIPHFDKEAVALIIREAQRRSGTRGQLTLRLRELGGLIRVAGDIAVEQRSPVVHKEHVLAAKRIAKPLEQQIADQYTEKVKEYKFNLTEGFEVGIVNGLAVTNASSSMSEYAGIVLPIVAEVTPAASKDEGRIIATGKLGRIAREAVQNVSAFIKKHTGKDVSSMDIHIQFVGSVGGVEGDSASISVATAVISALEEVPVDQSVAMTGSLSVRGQVLPVGGVTAKIEAAAEAGLKKVIIPKANHKDVLIADKYKDRIEIIPVATMNEVLYYAMGGKGKETIFEKLKLDKFIPAGHSFISPDKAVMKSN